MRTVIDALGDVCPVPVVKTRKAVLELGGAGEIEIRVDNETAVENLGKLAAQKGYEIESVKEAEKVYRVEIRVSDEAYKKTAKDAEEPVECGVDGKKRIVVAVSSDKMGEGSDELGKVLIKGFIFALSEQETKPDVMLFYNGGARLTCAGSDSLEDLKNLEESGVKIMTCGTCLNHYGIADDLGVGSITNMYVIAETLSKADLVIKP